MMKINQGASLKSKLIKTNLALLFIAISSFGITIYYSISSLSKSFLNLNSTRSDNVKLSYQNSSNENIKKIKSIYKKQLADKAENLLSKDSSSLTPMISDNAFLSVGEFLQKAFEDDQDIIFASYYTVEEGEIKAWYVVTSEYKEGLSIPINYDKKRQGWAGKTKDGKPAFIHDPKVLQNIELDSKKVEFDAEAQGPLSGFDCLIPFVEGKSGEAVIKARKKGDSIGFLRYVLSPKEMQKAIKSEEHSLVEKLQILEKENNGALQQSQNIAISGRNKIFLIIGFTAILIVICGYFGSVFSAKKIAAPINTLTNIAESMSKGNYDQKIGFLSDDEIGILADSFQEMSNAIKKRDQDLAEINHNLEGMVEERTSTIKTILNNVKCGFLLIGSDLKVQEGYTQYCNYVFNNRIKPEIKFSDLLGINKRDAENLDVLIEQVFEDILDEDLNLGQIPGRYTVGGKTLQVVGSVVRGADQKIKSILFTVADATELERMERENQINRTLLKIMQQKKAFQDFVIGVRDNICQGIEHLKEDNQGLCRGILHTLKGNMSAFGLIEISRKIHGIEDNHKITDEHVLSIENEFRDFLRQHGAILSVVYDGITEEVFEMKKATLDNLDEIISSRKSLHDKVNIVKKWIKEIQLVKAADLMGPLPEYINKLSDRLNKKANLKLEGGDILIEPNIFKPFFQVLPHLIRNSLDHGIEVPHERNGKNETGTIRIEFIENENNWIVNIQDDGKGIDLEKIVKKGLEVKAISEEEVVTMTKRKKLDLIFVNGVSCTENVSDISGRGAGMAAVAEVIQGLGGHIIVDSEINKGTTFKIEIPKPTSVNLKLEEVAA